MAKSSKSPTKKIAHKSSRKNTAAKSHSSKISKKPEVKSSVPSTQIDSSFPAMTSVEHEIVAESQEPTSPVEPFPTTAPDIPAEDPVAIAEPDTIAVHEPDTTSANSHIRNVPAVSRERGPRKFRKKPLLLGVLSTIFTANQKFRTVF